MIASDRGFGRRSFLWSCRELNRSAVRVEVIQSLGQLLGARVIRAGIRVQCPSQPSHRTVRGAEHEVVQSGLGHLLDQKQLGPHSVHGGALDALVAHVDSDADRSVGAGTNLPQHGMAPHRLVHVVLAVVDDVPPGLQEQQGGLQGHLLIVSGQLGQAGRVEKLLGSRAGIGTDPMDLLVGEDSDSPVDVAVAHGTHQRVEVGQAGHAQQHFLQHQRLLVNDHARPSFASPCNLLKAATSPWGSLVAINQPGRRNPARSCTTRTAGPLLAKKL